MLARIHSYLWRSFSPRLNTRYLSVESNGKQRSIHGVGKLGESIARDYLRGQGCKVLYKNYNCPKSGELDVVAREGDCLCFVEVKTRTSKSKFNRPMDAVDAKKRRNIIKAARSWRKLLKSEDYLWRYDVVEVILLEGEMPEVVWVKQAFGEDGRKS